MYMLLKTGYTVLSNSSHCVLLALIGIFEKKIIADLFIGFDAFSSNSKFNTVIIFLFINFV